jgi:signal transduction histidine kinase/ligand-binding sensor domain-containing protein
MTGRRTLRKQHISVTVCASILIALLPGNARALETNKKLTQYLHRIWQAQPTLPQTSIYVATQTRDGYLWLGTQSGVVRFDGIDFSPVRALQEHSLGDMWARAIVEDKAGRVWMTSNDLDLVRISKDDSVKVFTEKDGLPTGDFSCLVPDPSGAMWACTATGLVRFRDKGFDVYQSPEKIVNRPLIGCRADDGTIWIAGGSVLASWNGSQFSRLNLKSVSGDLGMRSLLCVDDGLWIGTTKGLVHYQGGKERLYTVKDGLSDNVVLSLALGQDHTIWIGTRNGFSRLRDGVFDSYGYREGLSQNTVFWVYEDREGSLWVATNNGLNQFLDGAATRYNRNEGLPSDNMGPIFQDRRGNVWTGSLDGGLARFDSGHFVTVAGFPPGRVTTLAEDGRGDLWAGTDRGLVRLENGRVRQTYTTAQGLPSDIIRSLFRDHTGSLWVGTDRGPAVFREGRFVQAPVLARELMLPIAAMGESRDGTMWFAVERGTVYLYAGDGLQPLKIPPFNGPPFQDVTSIYTDRDGIVWMATSGVGLGMWRNNKLTRIRAGDGLFDAEIYGFVADAQDRLWMSCSKGFFWVNRSDLLKFADGKLQKVSSSPYSPLEGLRTIQGTPGVQPVGVHANDGRLWFSAVGWLLAFAPDLGVRPGSVPPVVLESVTVNGTSRDPARIKTLGPGQTNLEIQYAALTFLAPQRVNFRYILEGYDKDWTDAGSRREAFYTNLPPGKFRFRVAACGAFVNCNDTGSVFTFEVAPQFYQRAWFIPVCSAMLALLVGFAYRARVRRLRAQFVLVLAERSRIARELHDTLIQGFSGITMQMQAFANRLRSPEDRQALAEIIQDAGTCLQETRRSVAGLRAGAGSSSGIAAAIADAARHITQERDIRLKLTLDDRHLELPAEVKYNLVRITQEAVTNSVKHSGARNIEVTLDCSAENLRLTIRDDGRGMPRGDNIGGAPGHYGLIGMQERASQIGAEFELTSTPGAGTKISLRVPVTKEAAVTSPQERLGTV